MKEDFQKIENWLAENAPRIKAFSLGKPANEIQLRELEATIGKTLPEDFKRLYSWHNGLQEGENFGSLFFGMDFFSLERIMGEYNYRKENEAIRNETLKNADGEIDPTNSYNNGWLRFAFDSSHTSLYLDLAPANEGTLGQIIFIDDEYGQGILVAKSTAALVADFAADLENNLYALDPDALEDGNHYLEAKEDIDIVNWQMSERWKR